MQNSEQLEEFEIEHIEDIDDETHDQINEFYQLLEEIKDAEQRLAELNRMLNALRRRPERLQRAAEELGAAFAAIERHKEFIPAAVYNRVSDALTDFLDKGDWKVHPETLAEVLPFMLYDAIQATRPDDV